MSTFIVFPTSPVQTTIEAMTESTHRMSPHQEALFAPLRREDLPSFLVELPEMRILAATPACAALGVVAGASAPLGVKIVAKRVGMSLRRTPRVERVRLPFSFVPKAFACIAVHGPSGQLVMFADPLALAAGETVTKALPGLTRLPAVTTPRQVPRGGGRSVRFTWEADDAGRLLHLSPQAIEALGDPADQWIGHDFSALAEAGLLADGAPMVAALRSGSSFFGLTLLTGGPQPRRIEFGGVPLFDPQRRRLGTRGFGLIRDMDDDAPPAPPQKAPPVVIHAVPEASAPVPEEKQHFNVVPIRGGTLNARERSAFHEIARTLTEAIEDWPKPPADSNQPPSDPSPDNGRNVVVEPAAAPGGEMPQQPAATQGIPPSTPRRRPETPADAPSDGLAATEPPGEEHLLDRLPIGVVVQQGGATVRVNKTLLGWIGLKDIAEFVAAGGLAPRLVRDARSGGLDLESLDGDRLPVEVRLVSSPWNGKPALVHVIRSIEGPVAPGIGAVQSGLSAPAESDAATAAPSVAFVAQTSAQVAAQARTERAAARRQALDFIPFPVLLLDRNGMVEIANQAAADLSGFSSEDLEDEPFTILLAQESHLPAVAMLDRASAKLDLGMQHAHLTLRHRLGGRHPMEAVLAPAGDAGLRFCLVMREVSEPAAAAIHEHAAVIPAPANEAAPALSYDTLVRRISHDVRDPLNAVLAFVDSVKQHVFGPVGNARYVRQAEAAAAAGETLLAILDDLDGLTVSPAPRAEPVSLVQAIETALAYASAAAARRRILLRSSLPEAMEARCDLAVLARMLRMLLEEALAATPAEGQIIVSLSQVDEAEAMAVIQVRDGGPALSEEEIRQSLDPAQPAPTSDRFTRAGRPFRMAHLARLARAQGGSLLLKPGVDVGMLAQLRLPR